MKTQSISIHQNALKTIGLFCLVMVFGLFTNQMNAQTQTTERTVTGKVTSTDGVVPMATVILKGTNIGISCDENGTFTFPQKLKVNDVLLITSLGYKDREVTIRGNTTFIEPFLDDIPLIIVGALRTKPSSNN